MIESSYKVKVNMGWEFIIFGKDSDAVINKLNGHLDGLMVKDGYTSLTIEAKANIKNKEYTIEEYNGFVLM